jgi:hypothetical protein
MNFDQTIYQILEKNEVKKEVKKIKNLSKKIANNRMQRKYKAKPSFQQKLDPL